MIKQDEVYKIGKFNKPHGIHGELTFSFTDDIFDRTDAEYFICMMDGILVPFFIESYRFRSDSTALVKLDSIDTAEQARRFTNVDVYFPVHSVSNQETDELTWDFFIGFGLIDVHYGHLGKIVHVDTSTLNILFVVDHKGKDLLIPAHEEFIVEIDRQQRIISVNLPTGLLNMESAEEV